MDIFGSRFFACVFPRFMWGVFVGFFLADGSVLVVEFVLFNFVSIYVFFWK